MDTKIIGRVSEPDFCAEQTVLAGEPEPPSRSKRRTVGKCQPQPGAVGIASCRIAAHKRLLEVPDVDLSADGIAQNDALSVR